MEKQVEEYLKWLSESLDSSLPSFKELPRVPLYMEQVVGYINETVSPITGKEKTLTPFMVNNYVKAKIIKEPDGKKYHEEHLGYLMFISLLKETLSMDEMMTLIDLDEGVSKDKSRLYRFFFSMSKDISETAVNRTASRVADFYSRYKKNSKWPYTKTAEKDLRDSMGLVALRLAVTACINQRMAKKLLEAIGEDMYGAGRLKSLKDVSKKEGKKLEKAEAVKAESIATAKNAIQNEKKQEENKQKEIRQKKAKAKTKAKPKKEKAK